MSTLAPQNSSMINMRLTLLLLLIPLLGHTKIDGMVEFRIGADSSSANEMSVVGGGAGMINIYRYNAWAHADRMPKPFHKDTINHVWSYRAIDESGMMWLLMDESSGVTFSAMKDVWLKFKDYTSWWMNKDGITTSEKIQVSPEKKSAAITDTVKCAVFQVVEVNGDWIRVQQSSMYCSSADTRSLGWIRWRRKSQMTVSFR